MSDLTFNKIAGAVLATGLTIVGLGQLSGIVFAPEAAEKPGYLVEVVDEGGAGPAAEVPPDWGTVLPTADLAAGQAVFAKCQSCHNITPGGANGTGPNLWAVVGAKPGVHPGFAYSSAMTEYGNGKPQWGYQNLYDYLKAPAKYVPGTKMTFVGLKKQDERINMIAYLAQQGGTLPVPPPNPVAAAPPAADPAAAPAAEGAAAPAAAEASAAPAPAAK
jgi:cytochrome c